MAKLTPPRVAGAVRRERPLALLDGGASRPLIWVTAPAGSGKTTLVADWLTARELPHLWYQLDAGDNDPATFFFYLGQAEAKSHPRRKKPLPLLTAEYRLDIPTFTRRFFEALCGRYLSGRDSRLALVFDNFHELADDSALTAILLQGAESLPAGAVMVVISRREPPSEFSRLKAYDRLTLVDWNDLRFNLEETRETVDRLRAGRCMDVGCPGPDLLHEKTGGWAAGLRLMIAASEPRRQTFRQSSPDAPVPHCLESLTWKEDIFSFFACEVMRRTEPELRDFLIATALLPFTTSAIAAQLTGRDDAAAILRDLSRSNYFTDCYPGPVPVYRYHPLFREFLQEQALSRYAADERELIRRRGAELFEEAGFIEEAVSLFKQLGEYGRVVPLIKKTAWGLLAQGRLQTVDDLLQDLPQETQSADPVLQHLAGLCRFPVDPRQARQLLESAFGMFVERGEYEVAIAICECILESIIYVGDDLTGLDRYIDWLDGIAAGAETAVREALKKISGTVLFALAYRIPDHHTLPIWLARAEEALAAADDAMDCLKLCNHLMAYYLFRGEFCSIVRVMNTAEGWKKEAKAVPLLELLCLLLDSFYSVFVQGAWTEGIALARNGLERAKETGVRVYDAWFSYLVVFASFLAGDLETAETVLRQMFIDRAHASRKKLAELQDLAGNLAFCKGDWNGAAEHFGASLDLNLRIGDRYGSVWAKICLGQARYCCGEIDAARDILTKAAAENWAHSRLFRFQGMSVSAMIDLGKGAEARGLAALREALGLARKNAIPLLPFWNRKMSAALLARALDAGIEAEFVRNLVARYKLAPPAGAATASDWPWPLKIHTLGGFTILQNDQPLDIGGWQKKPQELLKALIALGGRDVPEERILDVLWPDADGDAARASLKTILRRLRQFLGSEGFILLKNGRLSLSESDCWVDALAFLAGVGNDGAKSEGALSLYQGPFLPDDEAQGWSVAMRERTRRQFLRLLNTLAESLMATGCLADAAIRYEQAVEIDDLDEDLYRHLMQCYGRMNRRDKVAQVYQRYCVALGARLGIEPSPQLQRLHQLLLTGKPS